MGDDPPHGPGPGGFPEQGGQADHRETDPKDPGWKLGLTPPPPPGGGNAGGGVGGGGAVRIEESEYGHTVHSDAENSGPLRGSGAEDREVGY